MPDFEVSDVSKMKVEKLVADVTDADVDEAVTKLAQQTRSFSPRGEGRESAAKDGDAVKMDFVGRTAWTARNSRAARRKTSISRSDRTSSFPVSEEQLIGAKVGDVRDVNVTFPADYPEAKARVETCCVRSDGQEVSKPEPVEIDDELAKKLGMEIKLTALRDRVREQLKTDYSRASRMHLKRRILDALDEAHSFSLPPTMVEGRVRRNLEGCSRPS